jgi:adenylate cyclase
MARLRPIREEQGTIHPAADEVRAYLRSLIASCDFDASERNRRFLSYVVEETLEGRTDRIKAYNIALAAFDRREDFDPLSDPIVRIEAKRLRQSLEHYYLTAGKSDSIRIDIPKGSYAATFDYASEAIGQGEPREDAPETGPAGHEDLAPRTPKRKLPPVLAWFAAIIVLIALGVAAFALFDPGRETGAVANRIRGPAVLVTPFEYVGNDATYAYLARGLTYETIGTLTRFEDLFVYGSDTSFRISGTREDLIVGLTPDYILSGSVQTGGAKIRVAAFLAAADTNQYLWSTTTEQDLSASGIAEIRNEIVDRVATAIAQPSGFVFEKTARQVAAKPAEDLRSYECVVRFRQYWGSYSNRDFDAVRDCLERTIALDSRYARAYSSLALLYVDTHRFGFGASNISFDPLQRAKELADKSIELEPNASHGYLAKSMTLWFLHDVEGSIEAARHGLEINPQNTDLLAELGFRLAQRAKWDEAMPLIEEAYARNPGAPSGYHIATFLHQYMTGDYQAALESAKKVQTPNVLYGAVARALAHAQLGHMEEAKGAVAEILEIDPKYGDHVTEDLAKRNLAPELIKAIVKGLEKAGLQTSEMSNR